MSNKCGSCRFFQPWEKRNGYQVEHNIGECHRYPPQYLGEDDGASFPIVQGVADWCGEFSPPVQEPPNA